MSRPQITSLFSLHPEEALVLLGEGRLAAGDAARLFCQFGLTAALPVLRQAADACGLTGVCGASVSQCLEAIGTGVLRAVQAQHGDSSVWCNPLHGTPTVAFSAETPLWETVFQDTMRQLLPQTLSRRWQRLVGPGQTRQALFNEAIQNGNSWDQAHEKSDTPVEMLC